MLCLVKKFLLKPDLLLAHWALLLKKAPPPMPFRPGEDASFAIRLLFPSYVRFTSFLFYRPPQSPGALTLTQQIFHCLSQMDQRQLIPGAPLRKLSHLLFIQRDIRYPGINCARHTLGPRFDPIRIVPALFLFTTSLLHDIVHDLHFLPPFIVSSAFPSESYPLI